MAVSVFDINFTVKKPILSKNTRRELVTFIIEEQSAHFFTLSVFLQTTATSQETEPDEAGKKDQVCSSLRFQLKQEKKIIKKILSSIAST